MKAHVEMSVHLEVEMPAEFTALFLANPDQAEMALEMYVAGITDRLHPQLAGAIVEEWSPVCRICGCTDEEACDGGCAWVQGDPDLCTSCQAKAKATA